MSLLRPSVGIVIVTAACLAIGGAAVSGAQQPTADALAQEIARASAKATPVTSTKLDPALDAIAREWRRYGIRGAERESASRNVKLTDLRLSAVIRLASAERSAEVERALRKAWGEVVTVEGTNLYAQLPVPAIRRISGMSAVTSVGLDERLAPAVAPTKETPQ